MTSELDATIAQHTGLHAEGGGVFTHATTRQEFVYVPAGAFVMGMPPDELLAVLRAIDHDPRADVWRQMHGKAYARARPAHAVAVQAFLCGRFPMTGLGVRAAAPDVAFTRFSGDDADDTPARLERVAARAVLAATGWSAISEAQWEYVARAAGADTFAGGAEFRAQVHDLVDDTRFKRTACNALGVWGLAFGEWIADDEHATYSGAPTDGSAWGSSLGGIRGGGMLHAPWQNGEEAISCYAAVRSIAHLEHPYVLRPTIALPFMRTTLRLPAVPDDRSFKDIIATRTAEIRAHEKREDERARAEAARRAAARKNLASGDIHVGTVRTVGADGVYIIRLADANGILRGASRVLAEGDKVRVRVLDTSGTPQLALHDDDDFF